MNITDITKLVLAFLLFLLAGCTLFQPPEAGDAQTTVILQGPGNATILTTDNPKVSRTFTFGTEEKSGESSYQLPIERR